jgi:hypothetical protein
VEQRQAGVLVTSEQSEESGKRELAHLLSLVSEGQVKGVVIERPAEPELSAGSGQRNHIRKGALWGAGFGFMLGLIPLLVSTIMAAGAGALIAKASELRIQGGSPPRLRFVAGGHPADTADRHT